MFILRSTCTLVLATWAMVVKWVGYIGMLNEGDEGAHCIWNITWCNVVRWRRSREMTGLQWARLLVWRESWRLRCDRPCDDEARVRTWSNGPDATMKSKRSCNQWTNKAMWWHEVDQTIKGRSSQVLVCVVDQVAWWRMDELHAMNNNQW